MIIFKKKVWKWNGKHLFVAYAPNHNIQSCMHTHTHVNIVNQDTSKLCINISKWDTQQNSWYGAPPSNNNHQQSLSITYTVLYRLQPLTMNQAFNKLAITLMGTLVELLKGYPIKQQVGLIMKWTLAFFIIGAFD